MPKHIKPLVFTILFTLLNTKASALEQFDTEYDVIYNVRSDGITEITQNISIINKQDNVVATNYTLTINKMEIYGVQGTDAIGPLEIETETKDETTTLDIKFNEKIIGKDRKYNWELSYKSKSIATNVGRIWNINIPKVETLDLTKKYDIKLIIPRGYGPKISISPNPKESNVENNSYVMLFDKNSLKYKGVSASFGHYQTLNFQLLYRLHNNSFIPRYQEVALPPEIKGSQQIGIKLLDPLPSRIKTDKDGNTLAIYNVPPKGSMFIKLEGSARISGKQIDPNTGGKPENIPKTLVSTYTKQKKYWESNSAEIKEVAASLFNKQAPVAKSAQNAYNYVIDNLEYDFDITKKELVDRNGALASITKPGKWACMEFTDLFIAITRAMGIPSREINGYAIAKEGGTTPLTINLRDGDLLHSWAEFYDPNLGWIQVDPTWGDTSGLDYFTKLDTNHFAFVIKGTDPEYPYPAGSYKVDENEKQVKVEVAQNIENSEFSETIDAYKVAGLNPIKIFSGKRKYILYNSGNVKLYNVNGSGEDLPQFSHISTYIHKDSSEVYIEDFNGSGKYLRFNILEGKLPIKKNRYINIAVGVPLAILLYGMIYFLISHPDTLKKLYLRLRRRPPGQDL